MNSYDLAAMAAIQDYHKKHGKYPRFIEATAERIEMMGYFYFEFIEPIPDTRDEQHIRVPVVEIGASDIVFRGILVRNTDIVLEKAECATAEQFQRLGAKLARAGLLILEPQKSWGCVTCNPHLFFSQIEAWAFGEETAFDEAMQEK